MAQELDPALVTRRASDEEAGFEIAPGFEKFNQKDDMFRRSWWDERIRSEKSRLFYDTYREPLKTWRKTDGFKKQRLRHKHFIYRACQGSHLKYQELIRPIQ